MSKEFSGGYVGLDFDSIENDGHVVESGLDVDNYSTVEVCNHLDSIFSFLGSNDRDIVYLFFVLRKKQNDIASILKKTQAAVSYDTNRIKEQIDYIQYLISVVDDFIIFLEDNEEFTAEECDIMLLMFFTSSYTQTSKTLNMHQITLRNKFFKIIDRLAVNNKDIRDIFVNISNNLNKIKKHLNK